MGRRRRRPTLELTVALCVLSATAAAAPPRPVVAVLASEAGGRYDEVLGAMRTALDEAPPKQRVALEIFHLSDGEEANRRVVAELLATKPRVVVTLGRRATADVVLAAPEQPLVSGLVVDASELARAANATAIVLGHGFDVQLAEMRRLLPSCRTFGIIHDARLTGPARAAELAAAAHGLRLEARPVHTPKELPRAMASLSNSICALLGVPDPMVLSKHSARELLLFSFRNRIPFIGPSESWVEAGALYALDWRYPAIGRQLAGVVMRVVRGEAPSTIPRQWPDATRLVINVATAHKLGITLPAAAIEGADHVE